MSGIARRFGPVLGGFALVAVLATGCGSGGIGGYGAPASTPTPTPAATSASPTPTESPLAPGAADAACADIKQIKQAISDLQAAVKNTDLDAGKAAWSNLTQGVTALTNDLKDVHSAAAQKLHDELAPITTNFSSLDNAGKLAAVVTALTALGPNLNATIDQARNDLNCPD
jgi:hypothetical protein